MSLEIPLSRGFVTLIDEADAESVNRYKWSYHPRGRAVRVVRDPITNRQKTIYLHRFLLDPPDGMVVDHINGDPLDNRRCNLRLATPQQNRCNATTGTANQTGYRGLYRTATGKFAAKIGYNGQSYHLGCYTNPYIASLVYDEAARRFHGDFATLNHPAITTHQTARQHLNRALAPRDERPPAPKRSSRYRCVYWQGSRWRAQIRVDGRKLHLGYYDDEDVAARVVDRALIEHRGPTARLNLPEDRVHHLRILRANGWTWPPNA